MLALFVKGKNKFPEPLKHSRAREARFWVRDNGQGLSAQAQMDLFTPFTRLEQVRAKGHGLGLSIVRRIVEKLGGQVGVESQLGQGSLFFSTLPLAPPLPDTPGAPAADLVLPG